MAWAGNRLFPRRCSAECSASRRTIMTISAHPITIKKYANRRLYNTNTSTYVTLEDLTSMAKEGENFVVHDGKTNEDLTRSVLAHITFEQESKEGQNLLPINFLRQLIRFYGDSMQKLVSRYLEFSLDLLTHEQEKFRARMVQAFRMGNFGAMEEQVRQNMEMFERAFAMLTPFARRQQSAEDDKPEKTRREINDLKKQMEEIQWKLERISYKDKA
jgi:polyhydroxyalkanoate synthesis repressor PhaR